MRFQRPDNKSPWMNQKEQLRLVMLCVALVFVIVAMQKVAQPEFWSWLIPPEQVTQETNAETDQVVITLSGERVPTDEEAGSEKQALITELPPLLSEAEKQNIEDDYLGLKKTEVPVFQRIVTELTQTDRGLLQLNTDRSGTYQVWMAETDAWRGRLIEFDGHARRILKRENSTENQNGNLYDLWVTTEGSGSMPLHVVTAGLPAEMEIGEQLNIPIHLSGTLFKREGYAAEGG
ncbi:MAG: hypothetical protein KDA65_16215, partial [Planctomycetaceae bacterium]|nr:hypothetical protein [Planctomycetaceae bacterium]